MLFTVQKKGAALVACQFAALGLLIAAILALRFFVIAATVLCLWLLISLLLYVRLLHCKIYTQSHTLHIEKGLYFTVHIEIPICFITSGNIIETPLCRVFKVCYYVIHSSGKVTVVLGLNKADALQLLTLVCKGNS